MSYINELLGFDKLIFAVLIALVLYWIFNSRGRKNSDDDFNRYYDEIINSDKYKVKGQFESKE